MIYLKEINGQEFNVTMQPTGFCYKVPIWWFNELERLKAERLKQCLEMENENNTDEQ